MERRFHSQGSRLIRKNVFGEQNWGKFPSLISIQALLAHDIQTTSHVGTAGCICLHTNGMTHVHPWDEQTWIKIQTFLPPEMYILRMYGIRTFCTFLVCTKELFLVCTNMYRTSKCWFKLHPYLFSSTSTSIITWYYITFIHDRALGVISIHI